MSRGCSPGTVRTYGYHLVEFLRFCRGRRLRLPQVHARHILDYIRVRGASARPPAARTLNGHLSAVRGLFRYLRLLEPGAFKLNPIEDAAPVRSGRRWFRRRGMLGHLPRSAGGPSSLQLPFVHRLPETVSPEGIAALQGSFRSMRDRAMASLMFLVGLRSCEVLSLRLGNVDLRSGMIRVCGKGSHERVVPVDPDVVRAIEHYVRTERPPTASDHVFVVQKGPNRGLPLKPAGLRTIFRYHRRRAGVPEARPHRLRHTFATNMIEAGMRLAELQAQLGHTNVESTGIYVHLAPATIRKAYLEALRRARKLRP